MAGVYAGCGVQEPERSLSYGFRPNRQRTQHVANERHVNHVRCLAGESTVWRTCHRPKRAVSERIRHGADRRGPAIPPQLACRDSVSPVQDRSFNARSAISDPIAKSFRPDAPPGVIQDYSATHSSAGGSMQIDRTATFLHPSRSKNATKLSFQWPRAPLLHGKTGLTKEHVYRNSWKEWNRQEPLAERFSRYSMQVAITKD